MSCFWSVWTLNTRSNTSGSEPLSWRQRCKLMGRASSSLKVATFACSCHVDGECLFVRGQISRHQLLRHFHSSEHLHEGCDCPLEVQASGLQLLRLALGRRQIFRPIFGLLAQIPDLARLGLRLGLAPGVMESMSRVWLSTVVALASANDPALPRVRRGLHSQLVLQLTDFLEVRLCLGPERIPLPRCVPHQSL